ncbi:MAG: hypothetical protein WAT71_11255 [Ignavibacteria bacterium]
MRKFEKFILSTVHNNRSELIVFLKELKKYYPEFNQKNFTKQRIYDSIHSGKMYKDDVMRRLSSNLFRLGENFISFIMSEKDKFNYEKNLLEFYSIRKSDKFFLNHLEIIEELTEEQNYRDGQYFYNKNIINEIERKYMQKFDPTYKKSGYEKQIINLWKYTLTELQRVYAFAEYEIYFFNKNYDLKYLETLIDISERSDFMNSETVEMYCLSLKLYGNKSDEITFLRLKDLIEKNISFFPKEECFNFYIHLINYCNITELKEGKSTVKVKFDLVLKIVEYELMCINGYIDPGWFRGIFFMAFNAGEIGFAGKFLDKYKTFLTGKDCVNIVNHAYAQLSIFNKDYDNALKFLESASYKHINDKWMIKNMYLKIFYETGKYEEFKYCTDSIKHMIKEEGSWNDNLIIPIRNFMKISTKLFRARLGELNISADEIKKEILNTKVIGRNWLISKADELENPA